jgi:cellulose synthase/poly-beta-1,6-N-acetylglucosamine synthase-like glycosyltransferase
MSDQIELLPFIEDLVYRGIRPTRGLRMYRQLGGAIRTQRWFATYRAIEGELAHEAPSVPTRVSMFLGVAWMLLGAAGRSVLALIVWTGARTAMTAGRLIDKPRRAAILSLRALGTLAASLSMAPAAAGLICARAARAVGRSVPALARPLLWPPLIALLIALAALVFALSQVHDASILYLFYIGLCIVLGAVCWTTLAWMLDAWRSPESLARTGLGSDDLEPRYSFSLIVPARHEEAVLERTLSRLVETEHPDYEVLVVVGEDDPATRQVAERVAVAHPKHVKLVIDDSWPKNKPKALNTALPHCRGAITGVFDAEDDVHPALLRRVDQCFQRTDADIVQAGVQLMNFGSSWFAVRNVLEYYFWFRSRLHFHARQGFIPLGGNTVFVRTHVLREVGGWDPDCLAEDCELGVRLSSLGAHTVVFYEPELVTREETPPTLGAFARQRTRWNQGYLQTLKKGHWRRLPIRQQMFGFYTLAMPYLLALAWLMIPAALATAVAFKAPVPITLISFLPVLPMLTVLAVEAAGLGEFCRAYGRRASMRDYARLVLGLPFYQTVLAFASARAVAREARGTRGWEKTAHFGLHLTDQPAQSGEPAKAPLPIPLRPAIPSEALAAGSGELVSHAVAGTMSGSAGPAFGVGMGVSRVAGGLVAGRGREPLWVRLRSDATDGAVVLPPPNARAIDPADLPREPTENVARARSRALPSELAVLVPLLACLAIVQATNMLHWPGEVFDEGTYVGNAWAVQAHGALSNYTYGYGHPPLGWLVVSVWTWAAGIFGNATYSIDVARQLMFVISVISCALLYVLARRLAMRRAFAAGAVILFALSPLGLYFHRLVLLDNPATAWVLAAFVLALTPRRSLWTFAGSGACFAASVLSKETTLVLLPALLLAAAQNADRRTRRYCLTLLVSFFVLISSAFPLYATLKGEFLPGQGHLSLVGTMVIQLFTRKSTGSVFDSDSLAHGIVNFWLDLDPWLLGVALLLSPVALARRSTRAITLAYLIQVAMVLRPGYLPHMYVIGLLPFAALVVAGTAEILWRFAVDDGPRRLVVLGRGAWRASVSRVAGVSTSVAHASSPVAVVCLALAIGVGVAPHWARVDRDAMTSRVDAPVRAAQQWLVRNVSREQRLLVDDAFWIYLIEHGFDSRPVKGGFYSRTVVFNWPLDYDPAVQGHFPHGWRDFDYVVSTDGMRSSLADTPNTAQALRHSRVVATFGRGPGRIEIREIIRAQP